MVDRNAAQDPEQLKKLLILREHALADAWLRKDRQALDALLAPDFVATGIPGRYTKEELLGSLFPLITLHRFVIEDPGIQVTGKNSAILSYRCIEKMTVDRKLIEGSFRVFATYTCNKNQYQLTAKETRPEG